MDQRLLVLALGSFAMGTDSFVVAGVLPEIAQHYSVSIGAAGQMTTIYAVTVAILAPVIAALAANVPRKQLLLAGLAIFVIANLGTAIAPTFGMAMAARALAGLGAAMFSPTAVGSAAVIVPPERVGFALSVVISGLTISTALGSPLGTVIGGLGDWRWTMVFVAVLAAISFLGVMVFLTKIPMLPAISLAKRLAPVADTRVALTLSTTVLFYTAAFSIYTYFAVIFREAIGGSATLFGGLLVLWGVAGIFSNLIGGRLIDSIGSRKVLNIMIIFVLIDFALLHWTSSSLWSSIIAIAVWGAMGWGTVVPLQHRLVNIAPPIAPLLLGLNNSAIYFGTTLGAIIGAGIIETVGGQYLGYIAALLVTFALIASEISARKIAAADQAKSIDSMGGVSERARAGR